MRTTKLRTMITFIIAVQVALVVAAAAHAGPGKDKKIDTTTMVSPGFHRGG